MAGTYLDRILAAHRAAAELDDRPLPELVDQAIACPPTRGFRQAIADAAADPAGPRPAVVAEVKRRSPSKGDLRADLDPASLAREYERGGATCLSVLTDPEFFGGSPDDLVAAREATSLPVLRKDFTVSPRDVCDARIMGADAVLLIVAALDYVELASLVVLARRVGLDALVEVHDEVELGRAFVLGADLVGVNQRDLVTFEVDSHRAASLAGLIAETTVSIAESGVSGPADAAALAEAGYQAVLVGESLVTAADPAAAVAALRSGAT